MTRASTLPSCPLLRCSTKLRNEMARNDWTQRIVDRLNGDVLLRGSSASAYVPPTNTATPQQPHQHRGPTAHADMTPVSLDDLYHATTQREVLDAVNIEDGMAIDMGAPAEVAAAVASQPQGSADSDPASPSTKVPASPPSPILLSPVYREALNGGSRLYKRLRDEAVRGSERHSYASLNFWRRFLLDDGFDAYRLREYRRALPGLLRTQKRVLGKPKSTWWLALHSIASATLPTGSSAATTTTAAAVCFARPLCSLFFSFCSFLFCLGGGLCSLGCGR